MFINNILILLATKNKVFQEKKDGPRNATEVFKATPNIT